MRNNKGFSLVEVIVVAVIVAVLAAVAIPAYRAYIQSSQKSAAQSICELIGTAVVQTHNRGVDFNANDWAGIGITNPSDGNWAYTFPALAGNAQLTNAYAITATGQTGGFNGQTGTFKPMQVGAARWTGVLQ